MSRSRIRHVLSKLKRSALFRSRPHLVASFIALFATILSVSNLLSVSASSRKGSAENRFASSVHTLGTSIGITGNDESDRLTGDSAQAPFDEGKNLPARNVEKRTVGKGESIYTILTAAGLTPAEIQALSSQLRGDHAIRRLKAGTTYEIETGSTGRFSRFSVQAAPTVILHLVKDEQTGRLSVNREAIEYETRIATIEGTLTTPLAQELSRRNRSSLNPKLAKILSSRLDFRKEIHAGATYRILYQEMWHGQSCAGTGDILAVEIESRGKNFNAYRFTDTEGNTAYYDEKGSDLTRNRSQFIKPCNYSHVSSGFGYRTHPVTGRIDYHDGVDLAAAPGTPVRAVADGRIIFRGGKGNAGNMVTIAHPGGLQTMYLHLSRYAPACRYGKPVKQGEIIGYVGSSGRSTGPHLDFRVIRNGRPQNPLAALKQQAPQRGLTSAEIRSFIARVQSYRNRLGGQTPVMVADTGTRRETLL